jgi:hypothetical protein
VDARLVSGWPTKVVFREVVYEWSASGPYQAWLPYVVPDDEAIDKALIIALEDTLRNHGATPYGKTTPRSFDWTGQLSIPSWTVLDKAQRLALDRFNNKPAMESA